MDCECRVAVRPALTRTGVLLPVSQAGRHKYRVFGKRWNLPHCNWDQVPSKFLRKFSENISYFRLVLSTFSMKGLFWILVCCAIRRQPEIYHLWGWAIFWHRLYTSFQGSVHRRSKMRRISQNKNRNATRTQIYRKSVFCKVVSCSVGKSGF